MTTLVAPRIRLDAPLPRPPLFGLTSSPSAATPAPASDRNGAGAAIMPYPSAMPDSIDPCATGTARAKLVPTGELLPDDFPGFTAYLGEICTTFAIGDWNEWRARAEVALEARTSWALERQLAWQWFHAQPHLSDADADLPAGAAAVAAAVAVAYLDDYLAQRGQLGVIHLTPAVATYLGFEKLRVDGQQLRTASGTPVIVGTGYAGSDADNLDPEASGASEAAAGADWIFASGPVVYYEGEIYANPDTQAEATDRSDNTVIYRAERDLWVGFDGGDHAAVLADWSP